MAAAQLLVATDLRNLTDGMKKVLLNQELIALDQDPLGVAGGVIEESGGPANATLQVWARPLHDGTIAVALYNAGNQSATITSNFSKLPPTASGKQWGATTEAKPRDLWAHAELAVTKGSFSAIVEPHATKVVKLTEQQQQQ